MDDLVGEILIRVPPDEPAHLVLAALVCKPWRRILADRGFLRRYREFHRTPPLLGFLHNVLMSGSMPRFVPTTTTASPCSPPALGSDAWWALDSRHGRVLIHSFEPMELIIWDPIAGDQQHLPMPEYPHAYCTAAVLCATAGCDHLDCRGGPFKAVFVGTDDEEGVTWASEYSSETGAWSALTTVDLSESTTVDFYAYVEMRPSLLTGDALYFVLELGKDFLMYDLGGQGLWVVDAPEVYAQGGIVMTAEDGALGFAGVEGNSIYMYSWQDGDEDGWADGDENVAGWEDGDEGISGWADGDESTAGWVLRRVINLRTLLPICNPSVSLNLVGFIEGTDTIFMDTDAGLFILELMSGKVRKVGEKGAYNTIVPYTSFYAPVHATG